MNANNYGVGSAGGNREEVLKGSLTTLEPTKTPFTSMLGKTDIATTYTEVGGNRLETPTITGTAEGGSGGKGSNKAKNRERFGVYPQRWLKSWSVTDVQQLVSKKGGNYFTANEADFAYSQALLELKRDIEARLLSGAECQSGSGGAEMLTRGLFKWLSPTAQATAAVPENFRPPTGCYETGKANLTESILNGVLKALSNVDGGGGTYTMLCGNDYIEDMDFLLRGDNTTGATPETYSRFNVNHADTDKSIQLIVKVFRTTFGTLNVVPVKWLRFDTVTTGVGDTDCCAILNMDMWDFGMLEDVHESDTWKDSGGEGGDLKAIGSLLCYSPRGNGYIYNA